MVRVHPSPPNYNTTITRSDYNDGAVDAYRKDRIKQLQQSVIDTYIKLTELQVIFLWVFRQRTKNPPLLPCS